MSTAVNEQIRYAIFQAVLEVVHEFETSEPLYVGLEVVSHNIISDYFEVDDTILIMVSCLAPGVYSEHIEVI